MISVAEARARLVALAPAMPAETVAIQRAGGRVLASDVVATHDQPPFAASSMDGYALSGDAGPGARLRVIGEAAAGHPFPATVGPGEAVRIFTGAPLPAGADRVAIQEDVDRADATASPRVAVAQRDHVRAAGSDFRSGDRIRAPCEATPARVALAAAMGHAALSVRRRPDVAILMTGDELRWPGETLDPGAIVASNGFGLAAMVEAAGAMSRVLPIARDDVASLRQALALAAGADVLVTIGGASVGDHDIVAPVLREAGMAPSFHRVRMRPGKPLMAGRLGDMAVVGLPGNPVSALVCGTVFVVPMIRAMLGLPHAPEPRPMPLAAPVAANGPREHYMRARIEDSVVTPFDRQDSSLLSVLARSDGLVVRPPDDPARSIGDMVDVLVG